MINTIEEANRYFKYDLVGRNTTDGLKFYIPPLVENQFTQNYKTCLCKIRSVYIQGFDTANLDWSNGTTNVVPEGGVQLETNLISRNYTSISGGTGTAIIQSTDDRNVVSQRYGVPITLTNVRIMDVASDYAGTGAFFYEDVTSVFDTGLICSMPFGQVLTAKYVTANRGGGVSVPIYPAQNNKQVVTGTTTISVEFYLLKEN